MATTAERRNKMNIRLLNFIHKSNLNPKHIRRRCPWTPTGCKTPEQSIYGSIFREINNKAHPRIVKNNVKGKFVIAV